MHTKYRKVIRKQVLVIMTLFISVPAPTPQPHPLYCTEHSHQWNHALLSGHHRQVNVSKDTIQTNTEFEH